MTVAPVLATDGELASAGPGESQLRSRLRALRMAASAVMV